MRLDGPSAGGSLRFVLSVLGLALACSLGQSHAQTGSIPASSGPALGARFGAEFAVEAEATAQLDASERPFWVSLDARWDSIEAVPGRYDWSAVREAVRSAGRGGARVALRLDPRHPTYLPQGGLPGPSTPGSLEAWLVFVRGAVRELRDGVALYQIGDVPDAASAGWAPENYAFLLKNSALALRAEGRAVGLAPGVAQCAVPATNLDWQRSLWAADSAAYVDVLPLVVDAGGADPAAEVRAFITEALQHPPAATIWAYADSSSRATDGAGAGAAIQALAAGAAVGFVDLRNTADPARAWAWSRGAHASLAGGQAPAPLGELSLETADGRPLAGAKVLGRFFSGTDFSTLIFYSAPGEPAPLPEDRLLVDSKLVRNARNLDLATGETLRVGITDTAGGRAVRVQRGPLPLALAYEKGPVPGGLDLPTEEIETTGTRELTAEEIIARYQEVQKIQDDRLERWTARGRIDFHFKLAQGSSSVDVSIDSNYFWQRGGDLEWEQTDYYVNGNKVRWKKIPELPLIQPEKVITLPLDLTLDKTYSYRLRGRSRVGEREAYELEFSPVDPDAPLSLYRGRVWVDVQTFVRLKATVIQTGLDAPVLSNEEIDLYREELSADGDAFWMLGNIDGQQTWSAAGRTFVVQRQVTFESIEINPPEAEFQARLDRAHASQNQMLADTENGFRYLERQEDGSRVVKEGVDTSQLFVGGGAFKDSSTDGVAPLGGVNWFNYDLFGKGIQFNAFYAGVLGFVTASKPDMFGSNIDLTADGVFSALKFDDELFAGEAELVHERIRRRPQAMNVRLGIPLGSFWKVNLSADLDYIQYDNEEDGDRAIAQFNAANPGSNLRFILPSDHTTLAARLETQFNRRGYSVTGNASISSRSDWQTWGLFEDTSDSFGQVNPFTGVFVPGAPEPLEDRYERYSLVGSKEWFLRSKNADEGLLTPDQKVRHEIALLGGSELDRFSRYQFSLFGDDRLNGFSGSGVRFDEGLILRSGYSFNLFSAIRLDAVLENAWVERDDAPGSQHFSGVGLGANFPFKWKTVVAFSYGYALTSDIADLEGEQEFLLLVLKLF